MSYSPTLSTQPVSVNHNLQHVSFSDQYFQGQRWSARCVQWEAVDLRHE